jgi:hypothetical protein
VPHTYATLDEANEYIMAGGATTFATEAAPVKALKLSILESVSRRIDDACHRSSFGSGFGPRIGTNYYDGDGSNALLLRDDLQSISSFTVASATGGTGVSQTVTTDYFLSSPGTLGVYNGPPWRQILLHGQGSTTAFATGYRTILVAGTWGHSNTTIPNATTMASGFAASTTATSFTTSATPTLSPGMTLLVGSEQMYLRTLVTTTATVVRGANGTTAANQADGSAIAVYQYDGRVRDVALRLFMRRWKARDAGADGTDGGLDIPGQRTVEGEDTIIRRGLSDLVLLGMY